jgi:hypothetical protein
MSFLDISKPWTIVIDPVICPQEKAVEDFLACLNSLKTKSGLSSFFSVKSETNTATEFLIVLSVAGNIHDSRNGNFSWNIDEHKIEIVGYSPFGLAKGIYSFLSALGFSWQTPANEISPEHNEANPNLYRLARTSGNNENESLKYFILPRNLSAKKIDSWLLWGFRNAADILIVPPEKSYIKSANIIGGKMESLFEKANVFGFDIEIGGWELSHFVPRKYFFFHKEFFRMVQGKRIKETHFCPTNPDVINLIQKEARKVFSSFLGSRFPEIKTFHLWPEKNNENVWCNCPACRAFSFAEQNLIAANAAAEVLAEINPEAKLSYIEIETNDDEKPKIKPRKNMFAFSNVANILENENNVIDTDPNT